MVGSKSATNWPFVVNLANSIIGVAVLSFPLCFKQCGVVLGLLLLSGCAWLAYMSCYLLAKSATITRKRSYEYLAFYIFGPGGKLMVEICSVGLLLGTLITFFVIIGDIGPEILSELIKIQNSTQLRTTALLALGFIVILPLCMKSNLESISNLSAMSLVFYFIFAIQCIISSLPHISTGEFLTDVVYWDSSGIFRSLPIFALSYSCQIQVFLIYHTAPETSNKQVGDLVSKAILLSSVVYFVVGYFGYVTFYDKDVSGDVLMNYETTLITGLIKLAFMSSTILSFPLVVFPCRCSVYTLISSKVSIISEDLGEGQHENIGGTVHIPPTPFKYITCAIVAITLTVGILVPKVEFVLGLVGSTLGSTICYIFPAVMFLMVASREARLNIISAKVVLVIGFMILILSTWATLYNADTKTDMVDLVGEGFNPVGLAPPVTAPLGLAIDPEQNIPNSSTKDVAKNGKESGQAKVHSNLAEDIIKPKGIDQVDVLANEKVVQKRDETRIGFGDSVKDQKSTKGHPTSLKPESNGGIPERANMKKLLSQEKVEDQPPKVVSDGTTRTSITTASSALNSTSQYSTESTKGIEDTTSVISTRSSYSSNQTTQYKELGSSAKVTDKQRKKEP